MRKFNSLPRWQLLFGTSIAVAIIVFMSLYWNMQTDTFHSKEPNFTSDVENLTKEITSTFETTFKDERNSPPKFEVGEKYTYHIMRVRTTQENVIAPPFDFDISARVDRIERINNTEYYVLKIDSVNASMEALVRDKNGVQHYIQKPPRVFGGVEDYVDKESGNITFRKKLESEGDLPFSFYGDWMLSLKENFRWTSKGVMSDFRDEEALLESFEEGKVKEIGEINNIKCFVVEVAHLNSKINKGETTYRIINKEVYWIGVEKRVIVKHQRFESGVLMFEMNLINYEKSKK